MRPVLHIEPSLCRTCEACVARRACKTRAIMQFDHGDLPALDATRCLGCMVCIPACPFGAVRRSGERLSPPRNGG